MSGNAFRAQSRGNTANRIPNDFYQTPVDIADKCCSSLIKHIDYSFMNILDIGSGYGVFGESLAKYTSDYILDAVDIVNDIKNPSYYSEFYKTDVFDFTPNKQYDLVVGNPPYGKTNKKLINYVVDVIKPSYLAWLMPSSYIHGIHRYNTINQKLRAVYFFVERIDFTNSGSPFDSSAFFIYDFKNKLDGAKLYLI